MEYSNFAEFLTDKRAMSGLTVRCLAGKIGCPASLITEVEKDKKNPPRYEKLIKLAKALKLSPEETNLMFDLAGRKRDSPAPDLVPYILGSGSAADGIRAARDMGATAEEWEEFKRYLQNRHGGEYVAKNEN